MKHALLIVVCLVIGAVVAKKWGGSIPVLNKI
jgi:ribosomal protein S27E